MEFTQSLSSVSEKISVPKKQERIISIQKPQDSLHLKLDPNLDIPWTSDELARWIKDTIQPSEVQDFIKTMKGNLPPELQKQIESITTEDIWKMIAIIICAALLVASGMGIVAAVWSIGARVGAEVALIRIWTVIMSRPNITSMIMGLVPGMKNIAPNQAIAFGASEMKNIVFYILPWLLSQSFSNSRK